MFEAPRSPYLVPFDGSFDVATASTSPQTDGHPHKGKHRRKRTEDLNKLQRVLAAGDEHAVLLVFQAMDAAGKDSTIRAVMQGVDPPGCQVSASRALESEELDHDFLWRTTRRLPERGRIGIFNRSYYEEVLVVRVHPRILEAPASCPGTDPVEAIWDERLKSIRDHEEHLARNGTVILKFWLNVSTDEQKNRFLARIDDPTRTGSSRAATSKSAATGTTTCDAYEDALNATSRPWAPWYAIPADDKPYMRARVADIIIDVLQSIGLKYPTARRTGSRRVRGRSRRTGSRRSVALGERRFRGWQP